MNKLNIIFLWLSIFSLSAVVEYNITTDMIESSNIDFYDTNDRYGVSVILQNYFKEDFKIFTKDNRGAICKIFCNGIFCYETIIDGIINTGEIQLESFSSRTAAETFITDVLKLPISPEKDQLTNSLIKFDDKKVVNFIEIDRRIIERAYISYNPYTEFYETYVKLKHDYTDEFSKQTSLKVGFPLEIRQDNELLYWMFIPFRIDNGVIGLKSFKSYNEASDYLSGISIAELPSEIRPIIKPKHGIVFTLNQDMMNFIIVRFNSIQLKYEVFVQLNKNDTDYLFKLTKKNFGNSIQVFFQNELLYDYVVGRTVSSGLIKIDSFDSKKQVQGHFTFLDIIEKELPLIDTNIISDKFNFNITSDMLEKIDMKESPFGSFYISIVLTDNTKSELSEFTKKIIGNEVIITINNNFFLSTIVKKDFSQSVLGVKKFDTKKEAESFIGKLKNED